MQKYKKQVFQIVVIFSVIGSSLGILFTAQSAPITTPAPGMPLTQIVTTNESVAVTIVSPSTGPAEGGTQVSIMGSNFKTGATVHFGTEAALDVSVISPNQINIITPVHSPSTVDVRVTNPDGQYGILQNGFTFVVKPEVTNLSPNAGPAEGGTQVSIMGSNFKTGATVHFGTEAALGVSVISPNQINIITPAHSPSTVDVRVTNPDGQYGVLQNGFTFVVKPEVTIVSPNAGPAEGGTQVSIMGSNFKTGATVHFSTEAALDVSVISPNQINIITPVHSPSTVVVRVTNPDGQYGVLQNGFTFFSSAPQVSLPNTGGGTGNVVSVPVNAANIQGMDNASLTILYDPAILTALSASTGTLTAGWAFFPDLNEPGEVNISMNNPDGIVEDYGTLANIEFEVVGNPDDSSDLTISKNSLKDGDDDILVELSNGVFNVREGDEPDHQIFFPLIMR